MASRIVGSLSDANLPVTIEQVRYDCRIDDSGDPAIETLVNDALTEQIKTAVRLCMHRTQRSVMQHTRELLLDAFPSDISLPYPNILSVDTVQYIDIQTETWVTISSDQYTLDTASEYQAWLLCAAGTEWPATLDVANAVKVRYTAGYANASDIPSEVKMWIRSVVKYHYDHEGCELPRNFNDALLDGFNAYA